MKKSLILLTAIFLLACGEEKANPTGSELIEEEKLDGSISGYVLDSNEVGIKGIAITTSPAGYTTTTDFAGYFTIPKVEEGEYDLLFEGGALYLDTILRDLKIAEDQDYRGVEITMQKELDKEIEEEIIDIVDSLEVRSVLGAFTGSIDDVKNVAKVEVRIKDLEGKNLSIHEGEISALGYNFTADFMGYEDGGAVKVIVYDFQGHKIGLYNAQFFKGDGSVQLDAFLPINAMPSGKIIGDVQPSNGVDFELAAEATDPFGQSLTYHWELNGAQLVSGVSSDSAITIQGIDLHKDTIDIVLTIMDIDSNVFKDTLELGIRRFLDERNGRTYGYVKLGAQTWMTENLDYYEERLNAPDNECVESGQAVDKVQCGILGRKYSWAAALNLENSANGNVVALNGDVQGMCPEGWHVPTHNEWMLLGETVEAMTRSGVNNYAGKILKSKIPWADGNPNYSGLDEFGFNAIPTGAYPSGTATNELAEWWSTNAPGNTDAYRAYLYYGSETINVGGPDTKSNLKTVRCVK